MADTQRTRATILTLFADNVTGQIGAQDLRDFVVTVMESEFINSGDFWKDPYPAYLTTDKSTRGYHDHSQTMHADHSASFGMPMTFNGSGVWLPADLSRSAINPVLGIAADSYASGATNVKVLRRGIIFDSGWSRLSGQAGRPIYLQSASAVTSGDWSVTVGTSDSTLGILGYVELSDTKTTDSVYKWRFDYTIGFWGITGV